MNINTNDNDKDVWHQLRRYPPPPPPLTTMTATLERHNPHLTRAKDHSIQQSLFYPRIKNGIFSYSDRMRIGRSSMVLLLALVGSRCTTTSALAPPGILPWLRTSSMRHHDNSRGSKSNHQESCQYAQLDLIADDVEDGNGNGNGASMNRRDMLVNTAAAMTVIGIAAPELAWGLTSEPADNEIVKEQRQVTNKLDVNNAPVADYMQFPGMYPTIGGKISNNGPYASVQALYQFPRSVFSTEERAVIKQYEKFLTATPATGLDTMRGRDPYRRNFNK